MKQTPSAVREGSEGGRSASEGASREGEPGHDASPSFYYHIIYITAIHQIDDTANRRSFVAQRRRRLVAIIDRTEPPKQRKPHMADDQHDYKVGPGHKRPIAGISPGTRRICSSMASGSRAGRLALPAREDPPPANVSITRLASASAIAGKGTMSLSCCPSTRPRRSFLGSSPRAGTRAAGA
jgi:hypothetical protein